MNLVWKFIKNMRWFFTSAIVVFFLAFFLSHLNSGSLGGNFSSFVVSHQYFWLFFRTTIFLLFFFIWPLLVDNWAKKYNWPIEYTIEVKKRCWRYLIWFFVIDLTFQLL